jgi:hypothetical protein
VEKERTDCPVLAALACTIASVERRGARDRRWGEMPELSAGVGALALLV